MFHTDVSDVLLMVGSTMKRATLLSVFYRSDINTAVRIEHTILVVGVEDHTRLSQKPRQTFVGAQLNNAYE